MPWRLAKSRQVTCHLPDAISRDAQNISDIYQQYREGSVVQYIYNEFKHNITKMHALHAILYIISVVEYQSSCIEHTLLKPANIP
jgi:hypothetical protein